MKPSTVRFLTVLALLAAAAPALAAEESFVLADASSAPRFMPLEPVRTGAVNRTDNGLRAVPMRSDKQAMQNGFMRIDRATLRPMPTYRGTNVIKATATTASTGGVTVQRGGQSAPQEDAITDLFAPDSEEPTASFTDTLRGRSGGSRIRHSWPLPGRVDQQFTSGYGMRADPFTGKPAFHGGIDISAQPGTPVLASAEGTVSKVATAKGLGNYVAITHRDGTESYYGHLSNQKVRIGQHVMQGQQVGAVGSTGRSTGPHLDYRIKRDGETFNPLTVLRAPSSVNTRLASR
jgi:murein DD-endopeptidase MepM/ murein hydrolase activator NlpD